MQYQKEDMASAQYKKVEASNPDFELVLSYLDGVKTTMVVVAACELELFDKISECGGGATVAKLAESNNWHKGSLQRLMDGLVALRLLQKGQGDGLDVYKLTKAGEYLRKNSDPSLCGMTSMAKWLATCDVAKVVKEGPAPSNPAEMETQDTEDFGIESVEEEVESFESMVALTKPYLTDLLTAFDLSPYKEIVDLGGGNGMMAFELCRTHPSVHVTIVDYENIVKMTRDTIMPRMRETFNVSFIAGNFFKVEFPPADLYIFANILKHFNDNQVERLFTKVFNSCNKSGALILFEQMTSDAKDGPISSQLADVFGMATGMGSHRSPAEFGHLMHKAGFSGYQAAITNPLCTYDVIMAKKE